MSSQQLKTCYYCEAELNRNMIGLNKKLFPCETKKGQLICIPCMAENLEVTEEELLEKIEEFKREGCKLFS